MQQCTKFPHLSDGDDEHRDRTDRRQMKRVNETFKSRNDIDLLRRGFVAFLLYFEGSQRELSSNAESVVLATRLATRRVREDGRNN